MFSLAIDELRIVSTEDENQIVVLAEPRWLSRDTATREGDLVIGVEQQTADLINYYMVAHTSSENFVADDCRTVGMIISGEEHPCHLFKINNRGDQEFVEELELRPFLFAEISGPRTRKDAEVTKNDHVLFYDPPEVDDEEE